MALSEQKHWATVMTVATAVITLLAHAHGPLKTGLPRENEEQHLHDHWLPAKRSLSPIKQTAARQGDTLPAGLLLPVSFTITASGNLLKVAMY
ncbi:hypothetical protein SDC9_161479 [bioreactor metagenome]|uniref:Uncharacterized protein n=1 Tax=bioreactor metagenome TaxID=1076179 RepID=A0A645FPN8_9ZZZZ